MAATYNQLGQIANASQFQSRIKYAMNVAAASVYSEVNTTPGHAARALYATKVTAGNYSVIDAAYTVLGNSTIAAEAVYATQPDFAIPDTDIQFSVNSLWNLFAGA
jgi:hypothetical protein